MKIPDSCNCLRRFQFISGGTVDITAHEVLDSGVKELHHATGGACGGSYVDKNFEALLADVFGANFVNRLQP